MRKICVVVTARTSYTKIKPILCALRTREDVELQVVCAASAMLDRYGNVQHQIEQDGFKVDECVYMVLEAETLLTTAKSAGLGVIEFAGAYERLSPDVVMVMADRYEILPAALSASYLNIPLAHAQGGEVSGNIDEKVRHAVTKLADLHFPATERAREWLIRMGESAASVHCTGCPSTDICEEVIIHPEMDFDLYEKYPGVGACPDLSGGYIVVMQHPVTTEFEAARSQVEETLHAINELAYPVFWFWPNPDAGSDTTAKGIRRFREHYSLEHVHFIKNMAPNDFLRLLYASNGIVGNSSVAIRECSFLGVPAVNVGGRQQNRERGPNVVDVGHDREAIRTAITMHLKGRGECCTLYGQGNAGGKIAEILATAPLTFTKTLNYVSE
jgi:UDP-hydrolysing UDP-N-acetyl-D-glucosamine 2-epimerase